MEDLYQLYLKESFSFFARSGSCCGIKAIEFLMIGTSSTRKIALADLPKQAD
jgi:hypothetical protein